MLSDCPFYNADDVGTIICSEDTFRQITGQSDYTIIDIQLTRRATDNDVTAIHQMIGYEFIFQTSVWEIVVHGEPIIAFGYLSTVF